MKTTLKDLVFDNVAENRTVPRFERKWKNWLFQRLGLRHTKVVGITYLQLHLEQSVRNLCARPLPYVYGGPEPVARKYDYPVFSRACISSDFEPFTEPTK
jgi:hypothetical protein